MPLEIQAIRERTKTCTLDLGEDASLNIDYYPAKVSEITTDTLRALAAENAGKPDRDQRRAVAALLCTVATGWDVTSGGVPFPFDPDAMADALDDAFLGFCIAALRQDVTNAKPGGELASLLGTVSSSPKAGGVSSPASNVASFQPKSRSSRSRSKAM